MILSEIGTHAYHLLRYVTGLEANEISAEVNSLSSEISVDDNAFVLLRMRNKARGIIWVSSAATGGENGLKIRVYGTKGSIEWLQDDPNNLKFTELDKPMKVITRASKLVSNFSLSSSRIAAGHPEGFLKLLQIFIQNSLIRFIIKIKNIHFQQLMTVLLVLNLFMQQKNLLI